MRYSRFPTLAVVCALAITSASFAQRDRGGGDAMAGNGIEALTTVRVASNLDHTVFVTYAPGDSTRLFIVEKQGRIKILNLKTGVMNAQVFLNIDGIVGGGTTTNNEQGLLGLAFHPDYQNNGYFYVDHTNNAGATTIRRYSVSADPDIADVGSSVILLTISQPQSNHNGGWLGFGPNDGYLYISTGDGGGSGDNDAGHTAGIGNGQDITSNLLGKMLRIDVDGNNAGNYGIPADNPFVGITGDDQIWAYGLRNPYRSSFDRLTGDLYIGDVGQNAWEEINFQPADSLGGENYGWRCYEGDHPFNLGNCAPPGTMVFPIHEYSHGLGLCITGGYVYRGCDIPTLEGTYFFGDYVFPRLWSFTYDGKTVQNFVSRYSELSPSSDGFVINQISAFGEDARGELYIIDQGNGSSGQVFRIIPVDATISPADLDCNGAVGASDLLILLASWGPCDGCLADLNGDHVVGASDLLALLAEWG